MADYNPNQFDKPSIPEMTVVKWEDHEDWSALYVNGKLDRVGDHYLTEERIQTLAQVNEIHADFLVGGVSKKDAPATLDEVLEHHKNTIGKRLQADRLRKQAAELLAKADELLQ